MSLLAYVNALRNISRALGWGGGVEKRITQNRKLLDLLQRESPEVIRSHPEVIEWLQSNEQFLAELEATVALEENMLHAVTTGTENLPCQNSVTRTRHSPPNEPRSASITRMSN